MTLLPLEIAPDDGVAGVVGDVVPSVNGATGEKHFVSPKKSTELPDDYVTLKAKGVTAETFQSLLEWVPVVGGEAIQGNPLKYRVKRDATGRVEVKIKVKSSGQIADKMNVWIVWADVVPTPGTQVFHPNDGSQSSYETLNAYDKGWQFVFKIKPASICDGSISDYPNLKGPSKKPVPGAGKQHIPTPTPPALPADTAQWKWDVSRQMKVTLRNPGLIPKAQLSLVFTALMVVNQPKADDTAIAFPTDDVEGNDDSYGHGQDEDDDPYNIQATGMKHQVAEMASFDAPWPRALNSWGAAGRTHAREVNFREFARVELWDGTRAGGKFWFRISEHYKWYHYLRVTWDVATGSWLDANSSSGNGHPTP